MLATLKPGERDPVCMRPDESDLFEPARAPVHWFMGRYPSLLAFGLLCLMASDLMQTHSTWRMGAA